MCRGGIIVHFWFYLPVKTVLIPSCFISLIVPLTLFFYRLSRHLLHSYFFSFSSGSFSIFLFRVSFFNTVLLLPFIFSVHYREKSLRIRWTETKSFVDDVLILLWNWKTEVINLKKLNLKFKKFFWLFFLSVRIDRHFPCVSCKSSQVLGKYIGRETSRR